MENAVPPDRPTLDYPDAELIFGTVCAAGTDYRRVVDYLANLLKPACRNGCDYHMRSNRCRYKGAIYLQLLSLVTIVRGISSLQE
jgi:hypothetical protein